MAVVDWSNIYKQLNDTYKKRTEEYKRDEVRVGKCAATLLIGRLVGILVALGRLEAC